MYFLNLSNGGKGNLNENINSVESRLNIVIDSIHLVSTDLCLEANELFLGFLF